MGSVNHEMVFWTAAERERLRKHVADLPCPIRVAESLDIDALLALINAHGDRHGGYRLPASERDTHAWKQLVAAGVVESGWGGVGTFGMLVRKAAVSMKNRGELG